MLFEGNVLNKQSRKSYLLWWILHVQVRSPTKVEKNPRDSKENSNLSPGSSMNTGEVSTEADGSEMLQSILKQWLRWINIPGKEGRNGERYQLIRWIPVKLLPFFALLLATKETQRTQWHIPEEWQEAIFPFFCRGIFFFWVRGKFEKFGGIHDNQDPLGLATWDPGLAGTARSCWSWGCCQPKMERICCILCWNLETLKLELL